jgi:hypothetical protein
VRILVPVALPYVNGYVLICQMEEVYPGVNTVVLDEDAQPLDEPIVEPVKPKKFSTLLEQKGRYSGRRQSTL